MSSRRLIHREMSRFTYGFGSSTVSTIVLAYDVSVDAVLRYGARTFGAQRAKIGKAARASLRVSFTRTRPTSHGEPNATRRSGCTRRHVTSPPIDTTVCTGASGTQAR
jgi:hypothetical protein